MKPKNSKLIAQGAEAKLFRESNVLIKDRQKKSYRIKEIDDRLRSQRTKREVKILEKLNTLSIAPKVRKSDKTKIHMDYIDGTVAKNAWNKKYQSLSIDAATILAQLHNKNIIHGDLTTSNMMLKDKLYFIDFGLSYVSKRVEDKAVDLHLFRQALESKHQKVWKRSFAIFKKEYQKQANQATQILKRFEQVENRGRHKSK